MPSGNSVITTSYKEDPQQRGLAGPVGTDDAEHVAGRDHHRDVLKRHARAVRLGDRTRGEDT